MTAHLTSDQQLILGILGLALVLFAWGRWRFDLVALMALLATVLCGLVPAHQAFSGFGHPAVVTVVAVLIISQALSTSGAIDSMGRTFGQFGHRPLLQLSLLLCTIAAFSAFMNNVGALALLMPLTLQLCRKANRSPATMLMPLSFASLLGGLVTLIGTPPNIIISGYRREVTGESFSMFDFAPVGLGVALVGILFIALIGWRLLPKGRRPVGELEGFFDAHNYVTEVRITANSPLCNQELRAVENLTDGDVAILALLRGKRRLLAPGPFELLKTEDVLILEGHSEALQNLVEKMDLRMEGEKRFRPQDVSSKRIGVFEVVVAPASRIEGRNAYALQMHERFGVNLLAISRQGTSLTQRLSRVNLQVGDVLLLQADSERIGETLNLLGFLPLAHREIKFGHSKKSWPVIVTFGIAITLTAAGILPASISFTAAVLVIILTNMLTLREAYNSIQGPIIILIGAMMPVGQALQDTGATSVLATLLSDVTYSMPHWAILTLLMVSSMLLSDIINNAATAVIMAPIAVGLADALSLPIDPFLMAVCVGSSATFLTPIGHQCNALVMGPGGYAFRDYWRMGLPLGICVVATAIPLILWVWPF